jgi:dihydroorotate dehydrogenase (NAD+) catalytic subunit
MAIDYRTGRSRLGNPTGGLSGPAIKPITLKLVWDIRKAVEIPVIGLGGVETVDDVLDYLSVGAVAVQVGTASFADPAATRRLVDGLEEAVSDAKAFTIKDIVTDFRTEIG